MISVEPCRTHNVNHFHNSIRGPPVGNGGVVYNNQSQIRPNGLVDGFVGAMVGHEEGLGQSANRRSGRGSSSTGDNTVVSLGDSTVDSTTGWDGRIWTWEF